MAGIGSRIGRLPRLWRHEGLASGLRRVVLRCLEIAARVRAGNPHGARLALKRARAVLRLLEDAGTSSARHHRRTLTDFLRKLGPARDRCVVRERFLSLEACRHGKPARLARRLAASPASNDGAAASAPSTWSAGLRRRQAALARSLPLVLSSPALALALGRSARRCLRRGRKARGASRLHRWRSATIVLREQLRVLEPVLSPCNRRLHARIHRIAADLGEAGDWRLLLKRLASSGPGLRSDRRHLERRVTTFRRQAVRRARRRWTPLQGTLAGPWP